VNDPSERVAREVIDEITSFSGMVWSWRMIDDAT